MKTKKKIILFAASMMAILGAAGYYAAGLEAGSSDDPLVTESLLNQSITQLQSQLQSQISTSNQQISTLNQQVSAANQSVANLTTKVNNIPLTAGIFEVYINTDTLDVKSGAGAGFATVGTVKRSQRFYVFESQNGWFRILYNGSLAWISGAYTIKTVPGQFSVYINTATLDVKSGAGAGFSTVGTVQKFDRFDVFQVSNGWFKIQYGGGYYWISGVYTIKA